MLIPLADNYMKKYGYSKFFICLNSVKSNITFIFHEVIFVCYTQVPHVSTKLLQTTIVTIISMCYRFYDFEHRHWNDFLCVIKTYSHSLSFYFNKMCFIQTMNTRFSYKSITFEVLSFLSKVCNKLVRFYKFRFYLFIVT